MRRSSAAAKSAAETEASALAVEWSEGQPIYLQLRDLVARRVMDGSFREGEAIPSVRQVATEFHINHLTVGRAYQELEAMGLLEKRPGLGTYVASGARDALARGERERFLESELPAFAERLRILGITLEEVEQRLRDLQGNKHADHH